MIRVLRTELRRSSALWIGPMLAVAAGVMLWVLRDDWGTRWLPLALKQRDTLYLLWPMALGAGGWMGRRDARARMRELLATTARPAWQRTVPVAGALAASLALWYVGTFAAAAVQVAPTSGYFAIGALPVVAVGALSLVGAGLVGLAVGRMLPSAFTPPALVVAGLFAMIGPAVINLLLNGGETAASYQLLSPVISLFEPEFVTIVTSVHVGQVLFFGGLAATGFALYAAGEQRERLVAVAPAVLGIALAIAVFPADSTEEKITAPDPKAAALVCAEGTPKICVTAQHKPALAGLRGPATEALRVLNAKLPQAPTAVVESTKSWVIQDGKPQPADTLLVDFWIGTDGADRSTPDELLWQLVDGAGTRPCANTVNDHAPAREAIAMWLLERQPPPGERLDGADEILAKLRTLPPAEQTKRVADFRKAMLACENRDLTAIITEGAAR